MKNDLLIRIVEVDEIGLIVAMYSRGGEIYERIQVMPLPFIYPK